MEIYIYLYQQLDTKVQILAFHNSILTLSPIFVKSEGFEYYSYAKLNITQYSKSDISSLFTFCKGLYKLLIGFWPDLVAFPSFTHVRGGYK